MKNPLPEIRIKDAWRLHEALRRERWLNSCKNNKNLFIETDRLHRKST